MSEKFGTFTWTRGTIDIHDLDDIRFVEICMDKIGGLLEPKVKRKVGRPKGVKNKRTENQDKLIQSEKENGDE